MGNFYSDTPKIKNAYSKICESKNGRIYAYHCTDIDPIIIAKEGFNSNANNVKGFTDTNLFEGLYDKYLPFNICFISKDNVWDDDSKYKLKIDITGLELYPDFGHLVDFGAYYDEPDRDNDVLFWWKGKDWKYFDNYKPELSKYLDKTGGYLHSEDFTGEMSWGLIGTACIDGDDVTADRIVEVNGKPFNINSSFDSVLKPANESVYDDYNVDTLNILDEFIDDKSRGIAKKQWNLIDPDQYAYALRKFVDEGPEMFRFSERQINDWLRIIIENTKEIEAISILDGRDELNGGSYINFYEIEDLFPIEFEKEYERLKTYSEEHGMGDLWTRINAAQGALEEVGFYGWAVLPDGHPADTDNGVFGVKEILDDIDYDSSLSDKLVAINRCMDVYHRRSDWSSAFIKGGKASLDKIAETQRFLAANYPMSESFNNLHPIAVNNIVQDNKIKSFCKGLVYDNGEIMMTDELLKDIISDEVFKCFEMCCCGTEEYNNEIGQKPIKFRASLMVRNPNGLTDKMENFIKTKIGFNIFNSYKDIIGKFVFWQIGGKDYELNLFITNPIVKEKIKKQINSKKVEQMELF